MSAIPLPTTTQKLDLILSRLENVHPTNNGWTARCPAHDDRHNSLSVSVGDTGGVLIHCFAGCETAAVLKALGLEFHDLYPDDGNGRPKDTPKQQNPALSDGLSWWAQYCGVSRDFLETLPLEANDGHILFRFSEGLPQKARKVGAKAFTWDPAGAAAPPLWPMPGAKLPDTIWLTEGESDCTVARYVGLEAFALTKGATSPLKPHEALALAKRGVKRASILFDADKAGQDGAKLLAQALAGAGIEPVLIDLVDAGLVDPLAGQKDLRDAWLALRNPQELRVKLDYVKLIPDSRLYIGNGNRESTKQVIAVWREAEPKPRKWLVEGLVPERAVSLLYGDAGVYKSYMACALATCLCAGKDFLGLVTEPCNVLYVDTELDGDEFTRRAYSVARGMGLERPPEGLYYYRPTGSLADDAVIAEVEAIRRELGVALVVIDSLSLGAYGADMSAGDVTTKVMAGLKTLGTVLAIDHIAKPLPGANLSGYRPYGSQFKWAEARCITQVLKAESGDGLVLRPAKSNFGPLGQPIGVQVTFEADGVRFTRSDVADMQGIEDHLPRLEQVAVALAQHTEGVTPKELAEELAMTEGRMRNYLSALRKQGRANPDNGRWYYVNQIHNSQPYIGVVNCESSIHNDGQETWDDDPPGACHVCGGEVERYDANGRPWCERCWAVGGLASAQRGYAAT